ncbi:MAG: NAD(P)/FAD-dependent oxidoreductase [Pseudomonadota bacterium]
MAKIGVAGAGIGGLAVAAGLAQDGHDVRVFDRFETPLPVGSGLVVQPVGLAVLDELGAGVQARTLGQRLRRMAGHEAAHGRPVLDVTYDPKGTGRQGLAMHRAALHSVLLQVAEAAGVAFTFKARIDGHAGSALRVNGALTERFDLLVDAAGAASAVSPLRAKALPYGAIWGTVPWPDDTDLPGDELRQCYRRADRMIGVLPIGRAQSGGTKLAAIFWSLPTGTHGAWRATALAEWKAEAEALWPAMAPFLDHVRDHGDMTYAQYSHGALGRPFTGSIVHIGDAWHRASPQLGQGANMALLDAHALRLAVREGPLREAGHRMWNARRVHVALYQRLSAAFTPQYQSDSRFLPVLRDRVLFPVAQIWPARQILPRLARGHLVPPVMAGLSPLRAVTPGAATA